MGKPLRDEMPEIADILDALRQQFGAEAIDTQLRKAYGIKLVDGKPQRGADKEPAFWAFKGSRETGFRNTDSSSAVRWTERGVSYLSVPQWMLDAREWAALRGVTVIPADPADDDDLWREATELRRVVAMGKPVQTSVANKSKGGK